MDDQPITRPSLLVRLRHPDDGRAWAQFVAIYTPLVYRFARRRGLQESDAADVTQEVFRAVARGIRKFEYDCRQGSFRGWLIAVARSKLQNFLSRQKAKIKGAGGTAALQRLEQQPSPADDEAFIELEHRRSLFEWAVEQIHGDFQESTWQAFWQTGVEGKNTKEVAESLGMSVGAVYIARSRVLARLKEKIRQIEE
jgi:RNA polymerase sigma factor (sigma-70 family)